VPPQVVDPHEIFDTGEEQRKVAGAGEAAWRPLTPGEPVEPPGERMVAATSAGGAMIAR